METIVIFTATNSESKQEILKNAMKDKVSFSGTTKCCIGKAKKDNIDKVAQKQRTLKSIKNIIVVFDGESVGQDVARAYVKGIQEKGIYPDFVIFGSQYTLPNVKNLNCWNSIKALAA